ncbi:unnamed protein product [Adineta steineri]|uniref:Interferon-induced transmembrane protein n=1 Tax=Adineta steineri TaxID=433720 RepID=A0A814F793_9BILA|nr:unnamed protein product [Adineta steineri]CAF1006022.1 unnamed protein product [Adineta steineri]CAF1076232.1 unnamed protein product [Adineta steineri]
MSDQNRKHPSSQESPVELSAKNLQPKKTPNNKKKKALQVQTSKPKNFVKIKSTKIPIHFTWALVLTILCFFVIGPCWALYKTYELRRLIAEKDLEKAARLSNKISTALVISTIIGVVAWVSILFCSVGLLLTGVLLKNKWI